MRGIVRLLPRRLVRAWYLAIAVAFASVIFTALTGQHHVDPSGIRQDGAATAVRSDYPPTRAQQRAQATENRALFKCYDAHPHHLRWCVDHIRR